MGEPERIGDIMRKMGIFNRVRARISARLQPSHPMKQVIVMRKDLNMRKGKMVAQGAHASLAAVIKASLDDPRVSAWLSGRFTKVCVGVDSEAELDDIVTQAEAAGMITQKIVDSGQTEFGGVPTLTCAAIGPDFAEDIDKVTGRLKLL